MDEKQKFQTIDGFGYALTGGSAQHLIRMDAGHRAAILKELFATAGNGIGVSYLRLTIGASDLNERVFTYDDMPEGQTDPEMTHFQPGAGPRGRDPGDERDSEAQSARSKYWPRRGPRRRG